MRILYFSLIRYLPKWMFSKLTHTRKGSVRTYRISYASTFLPIVLVDTQKCRHTTLPIGTELSFSAPCTRVYGAFKRKPVRAHVPGWGAQRGAGGSNRTCTRVLYQQPLSVNLNCISHALTWKRACTRAQSTLPAKIMFFFVLYVCTYVCWTWKGGFRADEDHSPWLTHAHRAILFIVPRHAIWDLVLRCVFGGFWPALVRLNLLFSLGSGPGWARPPSCPCGRAYGCRIPVLVCELIYILLII